MWTDEPKQPTGPRPTRGFDKAFGSQFGWQEPQHDRMMNQLRDYTRPNACFRGATLANIHRTAEACGVDHVSPAVWRKTVNKVYGKHHRPPPGAQESREMYKKYVAIQAGFRQYKPRPETDENRYVEPQGFATTEGAHRGYQETPQQQARRLVPNYVEFGEDPEDPFDRFNGCSDIGLELEDDTVSNASSNPPEYAYTGYTGYTSINYTNE